MEAADRDGWQRVEGGREGKLSAFIQHDRHTWKSSVRSAMRATSQLPGRGPTDVDDDDDDLWL